MDPLKWWDAQPAELQFWLMKRSGWLLDEKETPSPEPLMQAFAFTEAEAEVVIANYRAFREVNDQPERQRAIAHAAAAAALVPVMRTAILQRDGRRGLARFDRDRRHEQRMRRAAAAATVRAAFAGRQHGRREARPATTRRAASGSSTSSADPGSDGGEPPAAPSRPGVPGRVVVLQRRDFHTGWPVLRLPDVFMRWTGRETCIEAVAS